MLGGNRGRQYVKGGEGISLRKAATEYGVENLYLQIRDQAGNLFDRLTAPSVRTDDGCIAQLRT